MLGDMNELWRFLPLGYVLTVLIEAPILLIGLSSRHRFKKKLFASFWLTACTYPIVVLVLPPLIWQPWGRTAYVVIAEAFAPLAECALFLAIDVDQRAGLRRSRIRDAVTIVVANLASFVIGGWLMNL